MNYSATLAAVCERPRFSRVLSTAYASRMVTRARSLTLSQSERRVPPGPIRMSERLSRQGEFYSRSRAPRLDTNAISQHRSEGCILPKHFHLSLIRLWPPSCHFDLGRSRHGWRAVRRKKKIPYTFHLETQKTLSLSSQIIALISE